MKIKDNATRYPLLWIDFYVWSEKPNVTLIIIYNF